jgi:hypothetical protein
MIGAAGWGSGRLGPSMNMENNQAAVLGMAGMRKPGMVNRPFNIE